MHILLATMLLVRPAAAAGYVFVRNEVTVAASADSKFTGRLD